MEYFTVNELQKAMDKDSDLSSHPISIAVSRPSDIRRMFDPISYSKGATLVRMIRSFLGGIAFKNGIQDYLSKFQYGNADQDDLWETLTQHGHNDSTLPNELTVKKIMDRCLFEMHIQLINSI